jgi:hypothetical protein
MMKVMVRVYLHGGFYILSQLVSPGDHRQNPAERAIQAFKSHFIATRSGTDSTFPQDCWDILVPLALITLNIMRPSRINPAISAYTQVKGTFDFHQQMVLYRLQRW